MIKKLGKKGKAWVKARNRLKKEFQEKGITGCEICPSRYLLSFHHRSKRRHDDKHIFKNVILLCANHHHELEYDKELTKEWFEKLRTGGDKYEQKIHSW